MATCCIATPWQPHTITQARVSCLCIGGSCLSSLGLCLRLISLQFTPDPEPLHFTQEFSIFYFLLQLVPLLPPPTAPTATTKTNVFTLSNKPPEHTSSSFKKAVYTVQAIIYEVLPNNRSIEILLYFLLIVQVIFESEVSCPEEVLQRGNCVVLFGSFSMPSYLSPTPELPVNLSSPSFSLIPSSFTSTI